MIKSKKDIEKKLEELTSTDREKSIKLLNDILHKIPSEYSNLIDEAYLFKRIPKEYLLSSILFSISTAMGLSFSMEALGYENFANLYFTIVGSRGDTKSEALKLATIPLKKEDDRSYDLSCELPKGLEEEEPIRSQICLQNATIESVHKTHFDNPNAIGVFIDELYVLIEKMGNSKSRDGVEWRTFLLEGYTNGFLDVARKTTKSFRIKKTYPTLLGGIQSEFIPRIFGNGNLESGFVDRLLFTPKLIENNKLIRGKIPEKVNLAFNTAISNILDFNFGNRNRNTFKKTKIVLSDSAEEILFGYTQKLIKRRENINSLLRGYNAKMQISIHKLCLIVHKMRNSTGMNITDKLEKKSVELAIQLNEYFLNNFKIILNENYNAKSKEISLDEIVRSAIKNGAKQKSVVDVAGVVKSTVSKNWKRVKKELETENQYRKKS